jgi:hypothetical protein
MPMQAIKDWWNSPGVDFSDPKVQALFGASAALLEAGKPGTRNSFGSAMGQGMQGAMGGYGQGLQMQYMQSKTGENEVERQNKQLELEKNQELMNIYNQRYGKQQQPINLQNILTTLPSGSSPVPTQGNLMTGEDNVNPVMNVSGKKDANNYDINDHHLRLASLKGDVSEMNKAIERKNVGGTQYRGRVFDNGNEKYYADVPQGFTINPQGEASVVPGFLNSSQLLNYGNELAKQTAKSQMDTVEAIKDGAPTLVRRSEALGQNLQSKFTPKQIETQKAQAIAQQDLPQITSVVDEAKDIIKQLRSQPGGGNAVGFGLGEFGKNFWPSGTPQAGFVNLHDQLKAKDFSIAFPTLKGGGSVTEYESKTAANAMSRVSLSLSEKEYLKALEEAESVLDTIKRNSRIRAGLETGEIDYSLSPSKKTTQQQPKPQGSWSGRTAP